MSHYAKLATLVFRFAGVGLVVAGGLTLLAALLNPASRMGGFGLMMFGPAIAQIVVGVAAWLGSEALGDVVAKGL